MVEKVQFAGDLLKDLKTDDNTLKSDDLDLVNFIFKKDKQETQGETQGETAVYPDSKEYFSTSVKKRLKQSAVISVLSFILYITSPTIKKYIPCIESNKMMLYVCLIFVMFNISMFCVTFV
jgi:hypothetical protein